MAEYLVQDTTMTGIADAIRSKTGTTATIKGSDMATKINSITTLSGGSADATAAAGDILSGKTAYVKGSKVTGTIATKTSSNLSASGATVTVPAGYYASQATKSVSTVTRANTTISATANDTNDTLTVTGANNQGTGYVTGANKTASDTITLTQNTPTINTSTGVVTASASMADSVSSKSVSQSKTLTLSTQAAKTVTPSTSAQTAVAAGKYTTGAVTVAAIPSTYVKPSATKAATTWTPTTSNQTIAAGTYCSGAQTIKGDANLKAANIKSGVSIFGVAGSLQEGIDIKGVIKSYKIQAGNTISAGDFVQFIEGGRYTSNLASTNPSYISAVKLDDTHALVSYIPPSSTSGTVKNTHVWSAIATIDGSTSTVTLSTATKVLESNGTSNSYRFAYLTTAALSSSSVIVVARNAQSDQLFATVVSVNISTSTITAGTRVTNTTMKTYNGAIGIMPISSTKVVCVTNEVESEEADDEGYGGWSTPTLRACVITVSGTTVSFSSATDLTSLIVYKTDEFDSRVGAYCICLNYIDSSKVLLTWGENDFSTYKECIYSVVLSVSGSTITAGTRVSVASYNCAEYMDRCTFTTVSISSTKVVVLYENAYRYLTISGTAISLGTARTISFCSNKFYGISASLVDTSKVYASVISYTGTGTWSHQLCKCTVSGDYLTLSESVKLREANSDTIAYRDIVFNTTSPVFLGSWFLIVCNTNSQNITSILDVAIPTVSKYVSTISGIAKTGGSGGSTIDIYVPN